MENNIRQLRIALGMTQEELAKKAGIQPSIISKLETGVMSKATIAALSKVAIALDAPIQDLINQEESDIASNLSASLSTAFKESGYSYQELANMTGIPKSAIQRYVTGSTEKIPADRLEKLAQAIGLEQHMCQTPCSLPGLETAIRENNRLLTENNKLLREQIDTSQKRTVPKLVSAQGMEYTPEDIMDSLKRCSGASGWGACVVCKMNNNITGKDCGKLLPALAYELIQELMK